MMIHGHSRAIGFVIGAMVMGRFVLGVACATPPKPSQDDQKEARAVVDLMVKVNRYQREHPWKETDRNWIRGTYYTGVMGLYRTTKDPAILAGCEHKPPPAPVCGAIDQSLARTSSLRSSKQSLPCSIASLSIFFCVPFVYLLILFSLIL